MYGSTITTFFGLTNPWLWRCNLFVDCKPLKILQVYENTCFGHVISKALPIATNDDKVSMGQTLVNVKNSYFRL
jgi:hypothetical protein